MTQPEALRLADELAAEIERTVQVDMMHHNAAIELRRLYAENEALREAAQQALEALEAIEPHSDSIVCYASTIAEWPANAIPAQLRHAITALRTALAEPQSGRDKWQAQKRGCSVCGIGANGETVGYVCPRSDCPTKITCGGAV